MEETKTIKARCLCNTNVLSLSIPRKDLPLYASICHCDSCRHASGTLYTCAAKLPSSQLQSPSSSSPTSLLLENLTTYQVSETRSLHFCAKCGTTMVERIRDGVWIHTGTLQELDGVIEIARQIFLGDTEDGGFGVWMGEWDGKAISCFEGFEGEQVVPGDMRVGNHGGSGCVGGEEEGQSDAEQKLQARCLCEGVRFWISRPDDKSRDAEAGISDSLVPFHQNPERHDPKEAWWLRGAGAGATTKFLSNVCACDSCRLASGADFMTWAFVPTSNISLSPSRHVPVSIEEGRGFGALVGFESSEGVRRWFCGGCGATIFWSSGARRGLLDVGVGLMGPGRGKGEWQGEGARVEGWVEWATGRVSFREDGERRAGGLVGHVEDRLGEWGRRVYGGG